jgi:hypothetical protein
VIRPVLAMIGSVRSNVQAGGRRPADMNLGFAKGISGSEPQRKSPEPGERRSP